MTRSKVLTIVLVALSLFAVGCASGGVKKPTVFVDKPNSIPADIPLQFDSRYERFISDKEMEEFHKLQTDEERQAFQDKFWLDRDTDPSTPENEYKEEIDERIENISNELFFGTPGAPGLSFRSNGGFRGNMAQVYLLHGEPNGIDTIESESHSFVPLMLWVYLSPEDGDILYAFLFYQRGGSGEFFLFQQDSYKMDRCGAIYQVATPRTYNYIGGGMQACPEDIYQIYDEIYRSSGRGGILNGNIFVWALFNFSYDSSISQGMALEPSKPASEIAKKSGARVVGEAPELTGTAGTDYILSSCESCNSMIPAEFTMSSDGFTVFAPWKNFDLSIRGEYLELSLKYRIVLESRNGNKPIVLEGTAETREKKTSLVLDGHPEATLLLFVDFLDKAQVAAIPSGTYSVSVYIKSTLTPKYNSWYREFTK